MSSASAPPSCATTPQPPVALPVRSALLSIFLVNCLVLLTVGAAIGWSLDLESGLFAAELSASLAGCRGCACLQHLRGNVTPDLPPFFSPHDAVCSLRHWEAPAARLCLRSRRIYIVGNSVARGFAFEAVGRFGGHGDAAMDRKRQIELCDKTTDSMCTLPLENNLNGAFRSVVRFHWLQAFDFVPPGMPGDACQTAKNKTRGCLQRILADSAPGDLFIFYMGLHQAIHRGDVLAKNSSFDYDSFLRDGARNFRESVELAWHGRPADVFHVRVAPAKPGSSPALDVAMGVLPKVNAFEDAAFTGAGWSTVDQAGINDGQFRLYSDHVHFPGTLSRITWNVILSAACV